MTTAATSLLGLALPVTGELTGTWGDTVNNSITSLLDTAVAGTTTLSSDADVTLTTTTLSSNQARQAIILWTAGGTVTRNITAPASSKAYVVINATSSTQSIVIRGAGPTTGVTIVAGDKALVAWNGTDFVRVGASAGGISYVSKTANYTATTNQGVLANTTSSAFTITLPASPATGDQVFIADAAGTWGTNNLTVGRNGSTIAGSATDLTCDISGISIQLVYSGTTWDVFAQVGGNGGTAVTLDGVQTLTNKTIAYASNTLTGVAGTATANTFTATQTLSGSTSTFATSLLDSNETVNVVAAAPSSTTNFYVQSGSVQYYTTSAANNWTLNIAFSSGTSMNTALATGQSVTFALVTTQGSTAYYNSAVTIDGTSVTPKWIGGAPTAGNASGLDVYRMAVIKTASATYTVLASLTQYK